MTFLRERFAPEMVTALARIEGRPLGIIANNSVVLTVAWPSAHLGPMGLEGAVRLGLRNGARGDRGR